MNPKFNETLPWLIFITSIAFIAKIYMAMISGDYVLDVNAYRVWGEAFLKDGLLVYVTNPHIDYPPLYMVLLSPFLLLEEQFHFLTSLRLDGIVLKILPILMDIATGILMYGFGRKHTEEPFKPLLLALVYVMHPGILANSSVWGQTDSILAFLIALSVILMMDDRWYPAIMVFGLSILMKPTALFFTPFIALLYLKHFNLRKALLSVGFFLAAVILPTLPFRQFSYLKLYTQDIGKYRYASLHAFNLHSLLGGDLVPDSSIIPVIGISFKWFGYACFSIFFVLFAFVFFRNHEKKHTFLLLWIYVTGVFLFLPMMHERYQYTAILFGMLYLMQSTSGWVIPLAASQGILIFINQMLVSFFARETMQAIRSQWIGPFRDIVVIFSMLNLLLFILLAWFGIREVTSGAAVPKNARR